MKNIYKLFLILFSFIIGFLFIYQNTQADNIACDVDCRVGETITWVPGTCCPPPWSATCPNILTGNRWGSCLPSAPDRLCENFNYASFCGKDAFGNDVYAITEGHYDVYAGNNSKCADLGSNWYCYCSEQDIGTCSSGCKTPGQSCSASYECCSGGICADNICQKYCATNGYSCPDPYNYDDDGYGCCSRVCTDGYCGCGALGTYCKDDSDCCTGTCYSGVCRTTYELTTSKAGTGSGTITSNPAGISCGVACWKIYLVNTTVGLTPTANSDSLFAGWSGDCSGTGSCSVVMSQSRAVTATFNLKMPTAVGYLKIMGPGSMGIIKLRLISFANALSVLIERNY